MAKLEDQCGSISVGGLYVKLGLYKNPDKMIYIECPNNLDFMVPVNKIFLGGGITGCENWQKEMVKLLENEKVVLFNPRRESFDINDPSASDFQINWEFENIRNSDMILFWFPCETLCPITLFELGAHSQRAANKKVKIFVGCHPEYKRKYDVITQMKLILPNLIVANSIEELANQIKEELISYGNKSS